MDINIFGYTDYREFLRDYYNKTKETKPEFSFRSFAIKVGSRSSSFLPYIISGKRNLTKEFIPNVSKAIGLSKKEHHYLEALVWFNQSKTPESKRYYLQLLHNIRKDKVGVMVADDQFEYFSNWYFPIIRELVVLPDFREDRAWIKKRLKDKVTIRQIRDALDKMLKLGLLIRDDNGRLRQANDNIITKDIVNNHPSIYTIHQQMLSLAKCVLEETNGKGSEFSWIAMPVSKKQFSEIRRMIVDLQNDVMKYLEDHPDVPECVSQFNVQFFKVTEDVGEENNK